MTGVLLVSTWGCPAQWKDAKYFLSDELAKTLEKKLKVDIDNSEPYYHCTSTALLNDVLKKSGVDFRVVLVILDSLVDKYTSNKNTKCYNCYNNAFREVESLDKLTSYRDLIECVEKLTKSIAKCLLGEDVTVNVIVAPAIGSPGGKWRFIGGARDFAAVLMLKLFDVARRFDVDFVLLDVTHGVNYMPTETMYVSRLVISALLASKHPEKSRFPELLIVNSDPYPPSVQKPHLGINLVYREKIRGILRLDGVPKSVIKQRSRVGERILEELKRVNEIYQKYAYAYAFTCIPTPLALCKMCSEISDEDKDLLAEIYELWIEATQVIGVQVNRLLRLVPEAIYAYIVAREFCSQALLNYTNSEGAPLGRLENLAKLYGLIDETYEILINDEIRRIQQVLTDKAENREWVRLCELYNECRGVNNLDERTMIAHGGLQKEFVEVNLKRARIRFVDKVTKEKLVQDLGVRPEELL